MFNALKKMLCLKSVLETHLLILWSVTHKRMHSLFRVTL